MGDYLDIVIFIITAIVMVLYAGDSFREHKDYRGIVELMLAVACIVGAARDTWIIMRS